jgi:hypothetical protein
VMIRLNRESAVVCRGGLPKGLERKASPYLYIHCPRSKKLMIAYHAALPFKLMDDGSVGPGDAIECPSAEAAIISAEILSRIEGNVGVVAFSRTGEPDRGKFEDAVVLKTYGDVPTDLTMLF